MATKDEMKQFALEVEQIVSETDYNYMEAIIEYCNRTGMEIDAAVSLINNNLKSKIEIDAQNLNLLPKTSRLPF